MPSATPIRAVIFDFNGVLVDDEHLHYELFRDALAEEGVVIDEVMYQERYLGFDDRGCFEAALADAGQAFDRARVDDLIARKAVRYVTAAEAGLRIFPAAPGAIEALAGRWPVAICSGALRPEIEFALAKMDRRARIAAIVSAEDTTRCKPDPQGYLMALDALRATPGGALADLPAEACLVVEDSLAGLEAARLAGMRRVAVTHSYPVDQLEAAGAEVVLDDLAELTPAWVDRRFGP